MHAKTEVLKEDAQEWDENREKRVQTWRSFQMKKTKTIQKERKKEYLESKYLVKAISKKEKKPARSFFEMKPLHIKPEERMGAQREGRVQHSKPMGLDEEYKKSWR